MDFKIKDEIKEEPTENDETCQQVWKLKNLQEINCCGNIDIKKEPLDYEEEGTANDIYEQIREFDENQEINCWENIDIKSEVELKKELLDNEEDGIANHSIFEQILGFNENRLREADVFEQLGTPVVIPEDSALTPPPNKKPRLSKNPNEEITSSITGSSSDPTSAEIEIKIVNDNYECDHCTLQTKSTNVFMQHLFAHHIRILPKNEQNLAPNLITNTKRKKCKGGGITYCCLYCDFQVTYKERLRMHILKHFMFRCSICSLEFVDIENLHSHLSEHKSNELNCSMGKFKGNNTSELKHHIREHKGREVVECPKCNKKLLKRGLSEHMEKIHQIYGIKCLECSLGGLTKKEIQAHLEKHLKNIQLPNSSKRTLRSRDHKKSEGHSSTHDSDFKSTTSPKKQLRNLASKKNDTKVFSCSSCEFETENKTVFNSHQRKVHFNDGVPFEDKKEKLENVCLRKEKLEYLWCYIYATNERFPLTSVWNRMKDVLQERGIIKSVKKMELVSNSEKLKLFQKWKKEFDTRISGIKKEVDKYRNDKLLANIKERLLSLQKSVKKTSSSSAANCKNHLLPLEKSVKKSSSSAANCKNQKRKEKLEYLWCYIYATKERFPPTSVWNRMKEVLQERGIIKSVKKMELASNSDKLKLFQKWKKEFDTLISGIKKEVDKYRNDKLSANKKERLLSLQKSVKKTSSSSATNCKNH